MGWDGRVLFPGWRRTGETGASFVSIVEVARLCQSSRSQPNQSEKEILRLMLDENRPGRGELVTG
jgi:hypothetical protein